MKTESLLSGVVGFILGAAICGMLGLAVGRTIKEYEWQSRLVNDGYAGYNEKTGAWEYKAPGTMDWPVPYKPVRPGTGSSGSSGSKGSVGAGPDGSIGAKGPEEKSK